jgi:hypothetical protein
VAAAAPEHPSEPVCGGQARERHRPEQTVLHQVLKAHFEEFVERAEEAGGARAHACAATRTTERSFVFSGASECRHTSVCTYSHETGRAECGKDESNGLPTGP